MSSVVKLAVAQSADQALERMVKAVNDGFSGGKVTKHNLTSWIISDFEENHFRSCIPQIRQHHFDKVAYLDSVLKELRSKDTANLDELLAPLIAHPTQQQKRRKGSLDAPDQMTPSQEHERHRT